MVCRFEKHELNYGVLPPELRNMLLRKTVLSKDEPPLVPGMKKRAMSVDHAEYTLCQQITSLLFWLYHKSLQCNLVVGSLEKCPI